MNRQTSHWVTFLCLSLIVVFFSVGCAQREATQAIEAAQASKSEAEAQRAPRFVQEQFTEANRLLGLANNQFEAGDYAAAQESAQQAQSRFISAAQAVPEVEARVNQSIAEIQDALSAVEQDIQTARDQGFLTAEQINQVNRTVEDLNSRMVDVQSSMIEESEFASFLAEVEAVAPQAKQLAVAHLQPQADEAIAFIRDLMAQAQDLDAPTHEPQLYQSVSNDVAALEAAFAAGEWQEVIDTAPSVEDPINAIIISSQQKAAGDIMEQVVAEVNEAKQLNITDVDAFTTALNSAENALQLGQDQLAQQSFAAAISAADEARSQLEVAYQALGNESSVMLAAADSNLQEALQLDAETYAPSVVNTVRNSVSQSQELISNERFVEAYTSARRALQASQGAPMAARRGKAQAALNQVERPFAILQQQGGSEYARAEFIEARAAVRELRALLDDGQFDAVEAGVPDAVELVQEGVSALGTAADEFIVMAERAIEDAEESGAPEWVGMQYANAVNLKDSAETALEAQQYLTSINRSEQAISTASMAESTAYDLQTNQNVRAANEFLAQAQVAKQDELAPRVFRQAADALSETMRRVQAGDARAAFAQSEETLELAEVAANALLYAARDANDDAVAAGAMTYSLSEIQQALVLLTEAEEAQAAKDYATANARAMQSSELAAEAEYFTWMQRSIALVDDLDGVVEELESQIADEKVPGLYRTVVTSLAEANVALIDEDYENAFIYADTAETTTEAIYDSMKADLVRTTISLKTTADWMGKEVMDDRGRGAKVKLLDRITELNRQIELENYAKAYSVANIASREAEAATELLERHNRNQLAKELKAMLAEYNAQNALNIVPDDSEQIMVAFNTLRHPDGESYEESIAAYEEAVSRIEALPTNLQEQAQQRADEIETILRQADEAGADTYFKEEMDELVTGLQVLRNAIEGDDYKMISRQLNILEKDAPELLQSTQLATAEDDYLQTLGDFLAQANNLMLEFEHVTEKGPRFLIAAKATEYKIDEVALSAFSSLESQSISSKTVRLNAELLLESVEELTPPDTLSKIQDKAIRSFRYLVRAGKQFEAYGDSNAYELDYREEQLLLGYRNLEKSMEINADLQYAVDFSREHSKWEKFMRTIRRTEEKLGSAFMDY